MGFLDKVKTQASDLKDKAVDAVDKNSDKIHSGLDKAGDFVDKTTKGKFTGKINAAKSKAEAGLDKIEHKSDDVTPEPPQE